MQLEINEAERFIKIKDLAKFNYFMVNILMGVIIINSILRLKKFAENQFDWLDIIWIIFGITGIFLILYQTFKKSVSGKIGFDEIESLEEKTVFGRKRFSIKLRNGKLRGLDGLITESKITELKNTFDKIGIRTIKKNQTFANIS